MNWNLDWNFWLPIILGGAIGLIASVIGNLFTPLVTNYWQKHKVARLEKTKKKAFEAYVILAALQNEARDKYLYFINQTLWGVFVSAAFIFASLVVFTMAIVIQLDPTSPKVSFWYGIQILGMAFSTYFLLRVRNLIVRNREWAWRLDHFTTYKSDLIKQFGELPKV